MPGIEFVNKLVNDGGGIESDISLDSGKVGFVVGFVGFVGFVVGFVVIGSGVSILTTDVFVILGCLISVVTGLISFVSNSLNIDCNLDSFDLGDCWGDVWIISVLS